MIEITMDMALNGIAHAVKVKGPEYVDPGATATTGCKYTQDGEAMCIVAVAMHHLGVPIAVLRDIDTYADPAVDPDGSSFDGVMGKNGFAVSPAALAVLAAAQNEQDGGETWAKAKTEAEIAAARIRRFSVG